MSTGRVRLVVIFGGQSAEHDVSRVTAAHVLKAIDPNQYDIVPIAITRDGQWVHATGAAQALAAGELPNALEAAGSPIEPAAAMQRAGRFANGIDGPVDGDVHGTDDVVRRDVDGAGPVVALPLLHGPLGEDGTVQGLLELLDVAYVGSGVLGSAVGMDKSVAKELLAQRGVPVANWITVRANRREPATAANAVAAFGLPVFVKPANMGSSVGVSRATTVEEIDAALDLAFTYDEVVLIEEAIVGREIEVAVLGDLQTAASVPGEIVPGHDFYDYTDKYHDGGAKLLIPAPLDENETIAVQTLALAAFDALRASGMARVDFFYEEGGRGFICNEINTIPGFTPISMYPKMWQASGLSYTALIDELVNLALARHARRRRRTDH